jgi:hypothetical protein
MQFGWRARSGRYRLHCLTSAKLSRAGRVAGAQATLAALAALVVHLTIRSVTTSSLPVILARQG